MNFQVGEAMQIHSGGLFQATPHCVQASPSMDGVSRSTFAVFLQPAVSELLDCPKGASDPGMSIEGWRPDSKMTFGEFSSARFGQYYKRK